VVVLVRTSLLCYDAGEGRRTQDAGRSTHAQRKERKQRKPNVGGGCCLWATSAAGAAAAARPDDPDGPRVQHTVVVFFLL